MILSNPDQSLFYPIPETRAQRFEILSTYPYQKCILFFYPETASGPHHLVNFTPNIDILACINPICKQITLKISIDFLMEQVWSFHPGLTEINAPVGSQEVVDFCCEFAA